MLCIGFYFIQLGVSFTTLIICISHLVELDFFYLFKAEILT